MICVYVLQTGSVLINSGFFAYPPSSSDNYTKILNTGRVSQLHGLDVQFHLLTFPPGTNMLDAEILC